MPAPHPNPLPAAAGRGSRLSLRRGSADKDPRPAIRGRGRGARRSRGRVRGKLHNLPIAALLNALLLLSVVQVAFAQDNNAIVAALPTSAAWLQHYQRDILPFWQTPAALGEPVGNFPTSRCNDGSVVNPAAPCPEFAAAPDWIKSTAGRQYTRMISRQIYLYGVAFHLTGDPRYLGWARAGVHYLLDRAYNPATGNVASYLDSGKPAAETPDHASQDVAYSLVGLSFYYYLTRDPDILPPIFKIEHFIRQTYFDSRTGIYRWERQGPNAARPDLVAQLDQVNAYMLLLTPILPEPQQKQWRGELARLAKLLRTRFYDSASELFIGTLAPQKGAACNFDRDDTDFGHSIKTYWMLYFAGRYLGDLDLQTFAEHGAPSVLIRAYLPETGSWAVKPTCDGKTDMTSSWWVAAELDQAALTFGLGNPALLQHIPSTFRFWLDHMVDHAHGEVWDEVAVPGLAPKQRPKIHLWKNGFHTAEHTLVGYIATGALRGDPVTLYYAFHDCKLPPDLHPYYFDGTVTAHQDTPSPGPPGQCTTKVTFGTVH